MKPARNQIFREALIHKDKEVVTNPELPMSNKLEELYKVNFQLIILFV